MGFCTGCCNLQLITVELEFRKSITETLCSDPKTITQRLVGFGRTILGRPLAIPHFCLDLKSIELSKLVCGLMGMSF